MKKGLGLILVLVMMLAPVSAFATDSYSDETGNRLQNGLANTLFGWTKFFSVPHAYHESGKSPWAGVGRGAVDAVHCTVAGAFNLLTFPIGAEMSAEQCVDFSSQPTQTDWEGSTQKASPAKQAVQAAVK